MRCTLLYRRRLYRLCLRAFWSFWYTAFCVAFSVDINNFTFESIMCLLRLWIIMLSAKPTHVVPPFLTHFPGCCLYLFLRVVKWCRTAAKRTRVFVVSGEFDSLIDVRRISSILGSHNSFCRWVDWFPADALGYYILLQLSLVRVELCKESFLTRAQNWGRCERPTSLHSTDEISACRFE